MIGWARIAKAIREDQEAQAQDEVEIESGQAMKQTGERLRTSLREAIAALHEEA